jgi:hypothetical protein
MRRCSAILAIHLVNDIVGGCIEGLVNQKIWGFLGSLEQPRAPDPLAFDQQLASAAVSAVRLDSASSHSASRYHRGDAHDPTAPWDEPRGLSLSPFPGDTRSQPWQSQSTVSNCRHFETGYPRCRSPTFAPHGLVSSRPLRLALLCWDIYTLYIYIGPERLRLRAWGEVAAWASELPRSLYRVPSVPRGAEETK